MEKKYKEKLEKIFDNYLDELVNSKKLASLDKNYSFDVDEINESLDDNISYLKDEMMTDLEFKIDELKRKLEKDFELIDMFAQDAKVDEHFQIITKGENK